MNDKLCTRPWTVAVSGGIAAGKTAVTDAFGRRGIHIWDADIAAREVVKPGSAGLAAIVDAFGKEVLGADGALARRVLRNKVFTSPQAKQMLEQITHPRIHAWLQDKLKQDSSLWSILAIPLLAESWPRYAFVDRILIVDAPVDTRITRLMQRDHIQRTDAKRIIATQAGSSRRLELADDVIHNTGDMQALEDQVDSLFERYQKLAQDPMIYAH